MKTIALHNLGCKVNGYEMDVMMQKLQKAGFEIVDFEQKADIYLINTCTVTNIADRKSRQMLHRAKKLNPDAIVVAVGCYVQTGAEKVEKDPAVDLAVGNNKKAEIVEILQQFLREREEKAACTRSHIIDINHTNEYEAMQIERPVGRTRAYLKIQDGCNQFCSYCIIPFARGRVRSRQEDDIINEAKLLAAYGCKEIVLTGIHISSYGMDRGQPELLQLLERLHEELDGVAGTPGVAGMVGASRVIGASGAVGMTGLSGAHRAFEKTGMVGASGVVGMSEIAGIAGIERIRLGSLEPRIITEEFADAISKLPKLCPHFHLSLQSGCDATLKRMNRKYDTAEFAEKVELLRGKFRDPAITTDVIVGFPGETEAEFEESRKFLERMRFYEMHIFKYSKRQGTRAAVMDGQLTEQEKSERSDVLQELERRLSADYRSCLLGEPVQVLYEESCKVDGNVYQIGHTKEYVKFARKTEEDLTNQIVCEQPRTFLRDDILI